MVTHLACEEINTRYIHLLFIFYCKGDKIYELPRRDAPLFRLPVLCDSSEWLPFCEPPPNSACRWTLPLITSPSFCLLMEIVTDHDSVLLSACRDCHWSRLCPFVCMWKLPLITFLSFCLHVQIVTDHVSVLFSADGDCLWSRLCPFACRWRLPLIMSLSSYLHVEIVTDHVSVLLSADGDCHWSRLRPFVCWWRLPLITSLSFCLHMEIATDHVSVLLSAGGDYGHWRKLRNWQKNPVAFGRLPWWCTTGSLLP